MAGSIMLHWKERLTNDDISYINEIIERFADANSDHADVYYDELCDSQLTIEEISELVDEME